MGRTYLRLNGGRQAAGAPVADPGSPRLLELPSAEFSCRSLSRGVGVGVGEERGLPSPKIRVEKLQDLGQCKGFFFRAELPLRYKCVLRVHYNYPARCASVIILLQRKGAEAERRPPGCWFTLSHQVNVWIANSNGLPHPPVDSKFSTAQKLHRDGTAFSFDLRKHSQEAP